MTAEKQGARQRVARGELTQARKEERLAFLALDILAFLLSDTQPPGKVEELVYGELTDSSVSRFRQDYSELLLNSYRDFVSPASLIRVTKAHSSPGEDENDTGRGAL